MIMLARIPALVRRLAAALALLAMLTLGLHEVAHAAGSFAEEGQVPALAGQMHLHGAPDHGKAGDPAKHHGAVPHSCHLCGAVMPMPEPGVVARAAVFLAPVAFLAAEHSGLDPGGPRRPPRAPVTA